MYFIVFLTYVFYCFCCFISFLTTIQLFWPQNNHLNFKQDPITYVWSIFRKNDFSICFVHKSRKWAIFGPTCQDKRSRDLVTVGPIFNKKKFKVAQDSKEESQRAAGRHRHAFLNNQKKLWRGGAMMPPPPLPPVLLGLKIKLSSVIRSLNFTFNNL